ncbi:MAG TPA: WYL domain-containing protein, partial [Chlorobiota bacterium]|nr:WYL domain-containing protein [Chlorobiota bacterium]
MSISPQIVRILNILRKLSSGGEYSTSELAAYASDHDVPEVSRRQIQRDLRAIETSGIPLREVTVGREIRWSIPKDYRSIAMLSFGDNELLSLYVLKGLITRLETTVIGRHVEELIRKLEHFAPGSLFLRGDVSTEVTPGRFINSIPDDVMTAIIHAIIDPHWDRVTYRRIGADDVKTFVVSFCRLVDHWGRLYVLAWHPRYEHYISLAVDRIESVVRANDISDPLHQFDEDQFRASRFGLFEGTAEDITLHVQKSAINYFQYRFWHPSQKVSIQDDGSALLTLRVPITPELVSWIVGWADVLRVLEPTSLICACQEKVKGVELWGKVGE